MNLQGFDQSRFWVRVCGVLLGVSLLGTSEVRAQGQGLEIFCPADVIIGCTDSQDPSFTGEADAVTDCFLFPDSLGAPPPGDGATPFITFEDFIEFQDCPGEYTILRNWMAFDSCEREASCVQRIHVVGPGPDIICPPDTMVSCNESTDPFFTGEATAADNFCVIQQPQRGPPALNGGPAVNFSDVVLPGNCPNEFVIQRVWIATDLCQKSSVCTQTITVVDGVAPNITCPDDVTLSCTDPTDPEFTGHATAIDNCELQPDALAPPLNGPVVTVTHEDQLVPGNCPEEYVIQRVWTATDPCNNSSVCTQTITVVDGVAPVVTCPANVTLSCTDPTHPDFTGYATATDNCRPEPDEPPPPGSAVSLVTHVDQVQAGRCANEYVIQRVWTAKDPCGNSSVCTQTLTVVDGIAPIISCPADRTLSCSDSLDPAFTGQATATDNCDRTPGIPPPPATAATVVTHVDLRQPGRCSTEAVIRRVWTATDPCGNSSVCTQTLTVVDQGPPDIVCELPPTVVVQPTALLSPTDCEAIVPDFRPQAAPVDNCGGVVSVTQTPPPGALFTNTVSVRVRAQDDCGNFSESACDLIVQCSTESACRLSGFVCLLPANAVIEVDEAMAPPGGDILCRPLAGVPVRLVSALSETTVQVSVTDSNGVYQFDAQAAGPYYLEVDASALPAGAVLTEFSANPTETFNYDPFGDGCPQFDFIYIQRLDLCGAVWYDVDGDGLTDENLMLNGLNGVPVRLRASGSGALLNTSVTANESCAAVASNTVRGVYTFRGLAVGNYTVEVDPVDVAAALVNLLNTPVFVVPPGFVMTTPISYQVVCGPYGCTVIQPVPGLPAVANFGMRYEPTAIELASFEAQRAPDGVRIEWITALEFENLGFHVYRSASLDGPRQRVNPDLVPGQGTGEGARYELLDTGAPDGEVYYWLEEIDWNFMSTIHGPVVALPQGADVVRVVRMQPGDPMELWSRGAPGADVRVQAVDRLSPAPVSWLPVPNTATMVEGGEYRTVFSPDGAGSARFFRVIHVSP